MNFYIFLSLVGSLLIGCVSPTKANDPIVMHSGEGAKKPAGLARADVESETATAKPQVTVAKSTADTSRRYVQSPGLNVRKGPGMKFAVLKVLDLGQSVSQIKIEGIWAQIGDGQYVAAKFLGTSMPISKSKIPKSPETI